jgi:uncharacterized protein (TIGR02246 family)
MNRLFPRVVLILPVFLCLTACTQVPNPTATPPDTRAADQKAIAELETAFVADWSSKDLEKILRYYADDAIVMEPNMPAMKGKEAIRSGVKQFLADRNFSLNWSPTAVEPSKSGDLAYVYGTWTATVTDPKSKKPITDKGKYASIYRKQTDGSWKVTLDINNSDLPAK